MDAGLEADQTFVRELAAWAKLKPSRIAKEAGLAATTITRPYNGEAKTRISQPTLDKLRQRFPDFPHWPDQAGPAPAVVRSEVMPAGNRPWDEKYGAKEIPKIPVVGSAIAMETFDPEHHIELTEVDMSEVLDSITRPASLERDRSAYGLTIVGDSMWPRFRPGRRVIVSPRAPVSIGDDVIVQLRGNRGDDEYRERVALVLVKELVKRSASYIELRQFNPDITFKVEADRVAAMHKVVGEIF